mmetsp:Transcript_39213/g.82005  ORF Transcript_39213/g.82005 Transcript_39213/m.82005 type:complete len:405 (+) Transcript_39213:430-1644(+)
MGLVLLGQSGRAAKIARCTLTPMGLPEFTKDDVSLVVEVIVLQFGNVVRILAALPDRIFHPGPHRILRRLSIRITHKRPIILLVTTVNDTIIVQISLGNPPSLQRQEVRPLGTVELSAEVPEVVSVSNAGEGGDLLEGEEFHDLVCPVAAARCLGRSGHPGHAAFAAVVAFGHPVAVNGAETEGRAAHSSSIGSLYALANIHRSTRLLITHVWSRTCSVFTRAPRKPWQVIIETIEPHDTIVCGKTPFSHNDGAELSFHQSNLFLLRARIVVERETIGGVHPRLVDVSIQCTIRASLHKSTPSINSKPKRIVHNKLPIGRLLLHDQIRIPVKLLQQLQRSQFPRLIHRLDTLHSRMTRIQIHNHLDHLQRMRNVIVIDRSIINRMGIELSHPIRSTDGPMLERR